MKSVVVTKYGRPENLEIQELPTPLPGPGEVCIRVSKAGINFADILSRMGLYPGAPKPPFTLGMEVSGIIHEVGPDVEERAGLVQLEACPATVMQSIRGPRHTVHPT